MLGSAYAMLPARNQEESNKFYEEVLGLEKLDENPGGTYYQTGSSKVFVYPSAFAGTNQATAVAWDVDNVENTVEALSLKGVHFEEYDNLPGVKREGKVHVMGSSDSGPAKVAWFKDPSGNILAIGSTL